MLNNSIKLIWVFMLLMGTSTSAGTITGKVTDSRTGAALAGVNMVIEGTNSGASTDESGHYVINDVPRGRYNLRAGFFGYCVQTKRIRIFLNRSTITENFELTHPAIPVVESDSVKAYQDEIYRSRNPISIIIDTLMLKNHRVELKVSLRNMLQHHDLNILRSVKCFPIFRVVIHDSAGNPVPRPGNLGCDDGLNPLPKSSDLFIIKARQTVQYPDPVASDHVLDWMEPGRYTVRVEYQYKLLKTLGPAYVGGLNCDGSRNDYHDEIDVLTWILRGHYVSTNNVFFTIE